MSVANYISSTLESSTNLFFRVLWFSEILIGISEGKLFLVVLKSLWEKIGAVIGQKNLEFIILEEIDCIIGKETLKLSHLGRM